MLTLHQLQARLSQLTYRPGYIMKLYQGDTEGIMWELNAVVEDSVNKGQSVPLHIISPVPPCRDVQTFDDFLFWRLRRVEIHECAEWLQCDGKPLYDPHRKDADRDKL